MVSDTALKEVPYNRIYKDSSANVLEEAIKEDFDSVVIIGFKGQDFHIKRSAIVSTTKVVGALEQAKFALLKECYE